MKFSISKSILAKNLGYVSKAIQSNSPIPALAGILFEVTEEGLILIGSNLEINIKSFIPKFDKEEQIFINEMGIAVLNNNFITEIVRKIEADTINFEIVDKLLTKVYLAL